MEIAIHRVHKIHCCAYSNEIKSGDSQWLSHVQRITFEDSDGNRIAGEIVLYLDSAESVIPMGDVSGLVRDEPALIED